jgi:muramoyltetrapeptide carboxypeptidase
MATIFPRPLKAGDTIAIVSPASIINPDFVTGAIEAIRAQGWKVEVGEHALGKHGTYSGTVEERLTDIRAAVANPDVRAILCSRGGYGAVHLLADFPYEELQRDPKWFVGFSDISAIHAAMTGIGIASIHSPMCKQLTQHPEDKSMRSLYSILRGEKPCYEVAGHPYNQEGEAKGRVLGGNLAVLSALIGTRYDILGRPGSILFIEDVSEPIYKTERLLYQLRLSGALERISGLIVGRFTEYRPDSNFQDMESMIKNITSGLDIPVAFNFPVGHVDHNLPLLENAEAILKVSKDGVSLDYRNI